MTAIEMDPRMPPREEWPAINEHCPMARTLELISTRTAFLVLREAFYGATRFEEFVQRAGISEPIAAARLRELVADGLMERVPYQEPGQRRRSGYALTEKGTDLLPVLVAMMNWGDRWVLGGRARARIAHDGCGAEVRAVLECGAGHRVEDPAALELQLRRRPAA